MKASFQAILSTFRQVFPGRSFGLMILLSLLFVFCFSLRKKSREKSLFISYSVCILLLFFLPPVQMGIGRFMREGRAYWRFLWLFPYAFVIACAAVELTGLLPRLFPKLLCCAALSLAIVAAGKCIYSQEVFQKAENPEKFPAIVPETVSVIQQNAKATGNSYRRLMAPLAIMNKTRQYDATILNAAGRIFFPIPDEPDSSWDDIIRIFGGQQDYDAGKVPEGMKHMYANYALMPDSYGADSSMNASGWKLIYERDGWQIWYEPDVRPAS